MCYARRQRSSWARIKLSKKISFAYLVCINPFLELLWFALFTLSFFSWVISSHWCLFGIYEFPLSFPSISQYCSLFVFSSFAVQFSRSVCFPLSRTALLVYHTCYRLSSTFLNLFSIFFALAFRYLCRSLTSTRLSYHIYLSLSSGFLTFFAKICDKIYSLSGECLYIIIFERICQ